MGSVATIFPQEHTCCLSPSLAQVASLTTVHSMPTQTWGSVSVSLDSAVSVPSSAEVSVESFVSLVVSDVSADTSAVSVDKSAVSVAVSDVSEEAPDVSFDALVSVDVPTSISSESAVVSDGGVLQPMRERVNIAAKMKQNILFNVMPSFKNCFNKSIS